jgi:hypothetical protein
VKPHKKEERIHGSANEFIYGFFFLDSNKENRSGRGKLQKRVFVTS